MRRVGVIGLLFLLALAACHGPQHEARQMVRRAERLFDTLPDSTVRLIDSVLRMPAYFEEGKRMDIALLQAEALFGDRDDREISPLLDDEFFDDKPFLSTSPELERAADYYARKKKYDKAAHAALYSGFVQQHYGEKTHAMQSFKDAERYGERVKDSLTVARAEYKMGKMLLDDGMGQEALSVLRNAELGFGNRFAEKAMTLNVMGVCNMLQGDFGNAEICLKQCLLYLNQDDHLNYSKLGRMVLNNYAVLYRIQKNYVQAIRCLRQFENNHNLDEKELLLLNLNLGNVFFEEGKIDSADYHYKNVKDILPVTKAKLETQLAAYSALCKFSEMQGDDSLTLLYRGKHESILYELMTKRQEQAVYRVQKQYDYESLQSMMNQRFARIQRIFAIGIVFLLLVVVLSLYHWAQRNKREAEINANLFHFMQQNKALIESNKAQEKEIIEATQQLSDMLSNRFSIMQKLNFSINNPKNKIALKELEREVFGEREHWDAVKEILMVLYPGLWETLELKYPEMNEMERRVCMLSRLKLSRMEEASLIGVSISVLDKLRTKVRKMMEEGEKQQTTC